MENINYSVYLKNKPLSQFQAILKSVENESCIIPISESSFSVAELSGMNIPGLRGSARGIGG